MKKQLSKIAILLVISMCLPLFAACDISSLFGAVQQPSVSTDAKDDEKAPEVNDDFLPDGLELELGDDNNSYKVTGYSGDSIDVVIPETYNGLPVTEIDEKAFSGSKKLISVVIPDSVEIIGDSAFKNCSSLEYVTIGKYESMLYEIGKQALQGCEMLDVIEFVGEESTWNSIEKGKDWDKNAGKKTDDKTYEMVFVAPSQPPVETETKRAETAPIETAPIVSDPIEETTRREETETCVESNPIEETTAIGETAPEETEAEDFYWSPQEINDSFNKGYIGLGEAFLSDDGSYVTITKNPDRYEVYHNIYMDGRDASGQYITVMYRASEQADAIHFFSATVNSGMERPNGKDQIGWFNTTADGQWHTVIVDASTYHENFKTDEYGEYVMAYLRIDYLNNRGSESIDIGFVAVTDSFEEAFELGRAADVIEYYERGQSVVKYDPATGEIKVTFSDYIAPSSGYSLYNQPFVSMTDYINLVQNITRTTSTTKCAVVDGSSITSEDGRIVLTGWTLVEGGVARYVWSVDGGKTWNDVELYNMSSFYNAPNAMMQAGGNMVDHTFSEASRTNAGYQGSGGIAADLSAYAGQSVDITFAAVPMNDTSALCPILHIKNVSVNVVEPDEPETETEPDIETENGESIFNPKIENANLFFSPNDLRNPMSDNQAKYTMGENNSFLTVEFVPRESNPDIRDTYALIYRSQDGLITGQYIVMKFRIESPEYLQLISATVASGSMYPSASDFINVPLQTCGEWCTIVVDASTYHTNYIPDDNGEYAMSYLRVDYLSRGVRMDVAFVAVCDDFIKAITLDTDAETVDFYAKGQGIVKYDPKTGEIINPETEPETETETETVPVECDHADTSLYPTDREIIYNVTCNVCGAVLSTKMINQEGIAMIDATTMLNNVRTSSGIVKYGCEANGLEYVRFELQTDINGERYIHLAGNGMPALEYGGKYFAVMYRVSSGCTSGVDVFISNTTSLTGQNGKVLTVSKDGEWHIAILDVTSISVLDTSSAIQMLRIDIFNGSMPAGEYFDIAAVGFFNDQSLINEFFSQENFLVQITPNFIANFDGPHCTLDGTQIASGSVRTTNSPIRLSCNGAAGSLLTVGGWCITEGGIDSLMYRVISKDSGIASEATYFCKPSTVTASNGIANFAQAQGYGEDCLAGCAFQSKLKIDLSEYAGENVMVEIIMITNEGRVATIAEINDIYVPEQ